MATTAEQEGDRPGKVRTWWHPLLASFLRWQLGSHYEVQEEVPVGKKPLQIDLLLLHKERGELSEQARKVLAGLVEYLNDYTLVELKSPSDTLRAGDFQTLLAYALLYRAQNQPTLSPGRLTLLIIAPRLSGPYAEELRLLGVRTRQGQDGIWRLEEGTLGHPAWLLETAVLAGQDHPVLTLLSPRFLRQGTQTYDELRQAGYTELVVYMAQQIQQFQRLGKEFAMQHLGTEDEMAQAIRDLLASMPVEQRLEGLSPERVFKELESRHALRDLLASMPVEQRLEGLSPEQLLRELESRRALRDLLASMPVEQRLEGLSPEQLLKELKSRQALRDLLASMPVEQRLEGLSREQLLKELESRQAIHDLVTSMPPEQRLEGLSPEDRLKGLAPEELERLKELLQRQGKATETSQPE
jgi:hypothetical protein